MPTEDRRQYHIPLSPDDDLLVYHHTKSRRGRTAELKKFCVEYTTVIDGVKKVVIRYDSTHGAPHVHYFDWRGQIGESVTLGTHQDSSEIFKEALDSIKNGSEKLKERFIASKRKYEHR